MKDITNVRKTLVGIGNTAPAASATLVGALTAGKFGVFGLQSATDGTPTGVTTAAGGETYDGANGVFIAVGIDGVPGYRATPTIHAGNIRYAQVECYNAGVAKILDFKQLCAECSADYSLKINITNANAWTGYGYQPLVKTFAHNAFCCTGAEASCSEMVFNLVENINADPEGLFTAQAIDPDTTAGADDLLDGSNVIDSGDYATWDEEADGCPNLRLIANAQAIADFCGIPYKYSFPTGVFFDAYFSGTACCSPAVTKKEQQAIEYPQGEGADVKYQEWYDAGNAEAGPIALSRTGVVFPASLNADDATNYYLVTIAYDNPTTEGLNNNLNNPQKVVLAVPTGSANTDPLFVIIDEMLGTSTATAAAACS